ncbi:MAG TPA: class I SAM-dependent methyltransferase [Bacillota bacterium]|nr:class I SAM-dependent methyltransferase [Bacillota bacterium]HOK69574.1 class I SAM-dependent methyltransferase [Bacillota bacterium]HPP85036.1 class I SAM-dependent methyltransferase [Bacillota bacterium]
MSAFDVTARLYDQINGDQYAPYAAFLKQCFRCARIPVREVLDLGCGTGGITVLLAESGFDMVAVDISPEMLSVAKDRKGSENILYVCQDMRALDLYGTVQAAYSSFDCLNYLKKTAELDKVFSLLRNYIETGGVLVFDVNTLYRYQTVFADNSYVYEFGDDMLVWQNHYSPANRTCGFYLTYFQKSDDETYARYDEAQKQRYFPQKTILSLLKKNRFSVEGVFGSTDFAPLLETSEKAYYVAVAI